MKEYYFFTIDEKKATERRRQREISFRPEKIFSLPSA